jgi:hypothetical protein
LDDEVVSSDHFKRPSSGSSTGASLPRNSLADEFGYMAEDVASADEFCYVAHELAGSKACSCGSRDGDVCLRARNLLHE